MCSRPLTGAEPLQIIGSKNAEIDLSWSQILLNFIFCWSWANQRPVEALYSTWTPSHSCSYTNTVFNKHLRTHIPRDQRLLHVKWKEDCEQIAPIPRSTSRYWFHLQLLGLMVNHQRPIFSKQQFAAWRWTFLRQPLCLHCKLQSWNTEDSKMPSIPGQDRDTHRCRSFNSAHHYWTRQAQKHSACLSTECMWNWQVPRELDQCLYAGTSWQIYCFIYCGRDRYLANTILVSHCIRSPGSSEKLSQTWWKHYASRT